MSKKKLPIGYQLYSCREDMVRSPEEVLAALAEQGYDFVETAGLYGFQPRSFAAMLEKHGLKAHSAHVQYGELLKDPVGTVHACVDLGCSFVVLSILMPEFQPGGAQYTLAAELLRRASAVCAEEGATFLYHNHDLEMVRYAGDYALETILKDVPQMGLEPDVCWLQYGGADPLAYLRRHAGSCPIVHMKDYRAAGAETGNCLAIGERLAAGDNRVFSFEPLGRGCVDIVACVEAARDNGAGYLVVEQDYSFGRTPLEAAGVSLAYLRSVLETGEVLRG